MCRLSPQTYTDKQIGVYQRRYDPTRTLTIRKKFEAEINKRFRAIRGAINKAIVEQDVFGLQSPQVNVTAPGRKAFDFPRSADKISAFMQWLETQVAQEILNVGRSAQLGTGIESHWSDMYVEDSYKRGVQRSVTEMRKAGYPVESIANQGGLQAIMAAPVHVDRLGVLYTRTFSDLKGITAAMDTQISRVLAQGIADGDNPRLLARKLNSVISGNGMGELGITDSLGRFIPAQRRALTLARTEIIRAHHQGMVQEYRNWEVAGLTVQAEFQTAGDNRVCSLCEGLQGNVYTLDEIQNLIPVHPNCRCVALPVPYNPNAAASTDEDGGPVAYEDGFGYLEELANQDGVDFALWNMMQNDPDTVRVQYEEVFGPNFNFRQLMTNTGGVIEGVGLASSTQVAFSPLQKTFQISVDGRTSEGKREFSLSRIFGIQEIEGKPERVVFHEFFRLAPSYRGQGTSKQIIGDWFDMYNKMGVSQITTHASLNVGGYTWGRYGFAITPETWERSTFSPNNRATIEGIRNTFYANNPATTPFPMNLIADRPDGRDLLLGSDWYGMVDLRNPVQTQRFTDYMRGRR